MAAQSDEDPNGEHRPTGWVTLSGWGGRGEGFGRSHDVTMEEGDGLMSSANAHIELKRPLYTWKTTRCTSVGALCQRCM